MPNAIKYSPSLQPDALKIGNYWIGTGDVGKGPTINSDYWNGITPPLNGYVVYGHKPNISPTVGGPSIYVCNNSSELLDITNKINSTNFTQLSDCLQWYTSQNDRMVFNIDLEPIITNDLAINLDIKFIGCYPLLGLTVSNIGKDNPGHDAILSTLGATYPTLDESGSYISFNDIQNQYAIIDYNESLPNWSVEVWFKLSSSLSSKVASILTNEFNGSNLNFSIGTNNAPTNQNLAVGFFDGSWHNTNGFSPIIGNWYQVVGTYDGNTIKQYVNGLLCMIHDYTGISSNGGEIRLMRRWDSNNNSNNFIDGDLSIVRLYKKALTSDEVNKNFVAQSERVGLKSILSHRSLKVGDFELIVGNTSLEDNLLDYAVCQNFNILQFYDLYTIFSTPQMAEDLDAFLTKVYDRGLLPVAIMGSGTEGFDLVNDWEQTSGRVNKFWGVNKENEFWNPGGETFSSWISSMNYIKQNYPHWHRSAYIANPTANWGAVEAQQMIDAQIDVLEVTNYNSGKPDVNWASFVNQLQRISDAAYNSGLAQRFVPLWSSESVFSGPYFGSEGLQSSLSIYDQDYSNLSMSHKDNLSKTGYSIFMYSELITYLPNCP